MNYCFQRTLDCVRRGDYPLATIYCRLAARYAKRDGSLSMWSRAMRVLHGLKQI